MQHDTGNLSTFFYKDVNGKVKPVVWDFNNSLGNVSDSSDDDFLIRQFVSVQAPWFTILIKDEDFINQVIYRYRQLRAGILSDEQVSACLLYTSSRLASKCTGEMKKMRLHAAKASRRKTWRGILNP